MCARVHVRRRSSAPHHYYFASARLPFHSLCAVSKRGAQISNRQCGPACRRIANVYLPKTSGSRCRRSKVVLRPRGVFTRVIIALTPLPYAGPFGIQTKKAPNADFFCAAFATRLSRVKWSKPPRLHSTRSTLLPRRSHVSH